MKYLLDLGAEVLTAAGFSVARPVSDTQSLAFEDSTIVGFLLAYGNATELVENWKQDSDAIIARNVFQLRRAAEKAWNTYLVFVATESGDDTLLPALAAIEEDLVGTRKIARVGIRNANDMRNALLNLLPLEAAPRLEALDMKSEIQQRLTGLPPRAVEAFLSTADEAALIQVLEEAS